MVVTQLDQVSSSPPKSAAQFESIGDRKDMKGLLVHSGQKVRIFVEYRQDVR